jgi:hypothetical protein
MNLVIVPFGLQKFCVFIVLHSLCQLLLLLPVKLESFSENNCLNLHITVFSLASLFCLGASSLAQVLGCLPSKPEDLCLNLTPAHPPKKPQINSIYSNLQYDIKLIWN